MPVFDAISTKNDTSFTASSGSVTLSHTCTGSNRCLDVFVAYNGAFGQTVTGITYGGVAMTALGAAIGSRLVGYRLVNPASGANDIVVSHSAGSAAASCCIVGYSTTDNHQTTPEDGYTTATGSDGSPPFDANIDVTSATGKLVVSAVAANNNVTWTTGDTERADIVRTTDGNASLQVTEQAGAATVTMDHAGSAAINFSVLGFSLNAPAAGGGGALLPLPDLAAGRLDSLNSFVAL